MASCFDQPKMLAAWAFQAVMTMLPSMVTTASSADSTIPRYRTSDSRRASSARRRSMTSPRSSSLAFARSAVLSATCCSSSTWAARSASSTSRRSMTRLLRESRASTKRVTPKTMKPS